MKKMVDFLKLFQYDEKTINRILEKGVVKMCCQQTR